MKGKSKKNNKPKTDLNCSKNNKKRSIDKYFLDLNYRFKNNREEWFSIMLRDDCNLCEDYKIIQYEIESVFGDSVEYFIPLYIEEVSKKPVGIELFDGYVFIKKSEEVDESCFTKKQSCLDTLVKRRRGRVITNRDINRFKTELKHRLKNKLPNKGDKIMVYEGTFKNMKGKVLSVDKKNKSTRVEFRKKTRVVEATLSIVNIEILD